MASSREFVRSYVRVGSRARDFIESAVKMHDVMDEVAVIGLGYIGLPTAAILANHGVQVTGVDTKLHAVEMINAGKVHIVEPDLEEAVKSAVAHGKLRAQLTIPKVGNYIVAVPTPFGEDREPDLSFVEEALRGIARVLEGGELIIVESTCPPGTTEYLASLVATERPDLNLDGGAANKRIYVAHCPERVLPGKILAELKANDRIVGGLDEESSVRARNIYQTFCIGAIHLTDAKTAELSKLVENTYRDVNIAFANELADVSSSIGVDVWEVIKLANYHPRVDILMPGIGVGGHCIAVDPWFVINSAPDESPLIRHAREKNEQRPVDIANSALEIITSRKLERVTVLGLSYKPDLDDVRNSPAVLIVDHLAAALPNVQFLVRDPHVSALPAPIDLYSNVRLVSNSGENTASEFYLYLVNHSDFKTDAAIQNLDKQSVYDACGAWASIRRV